MNILPVKNKDHLKYGWTRDTYIKASSVIIEGMEKVVDIGFKERHNRSYGTSWKSYHIAMRADIEVLRYAKKSLKIFESKNSLEESFNALFEFQKKFVWTYNK